MTEQDEREQRDRWKALGIRTDIPHPRARVRLHAGRQGQLRGRPGDGRAGAEARAGDARFLARQREFLVRAVRFLRDAGIRQFLDIGTGLPTSPNMHELAQEGHPDARVVYVDNHPAVFLRAEALMARNASTAVVRAWSYGGVASIRLS